MEGEWSCYGGGQFKGAKMVMLTEVVSLMEVWFGLCCLMTPGLSKDIGVMYDHTFYKQVQISRSDIRPHIKWAVSLVILHMITSIFLQALFGYIWVNILTFSPREGQFNGERMVMLRRWPV